MGVGTPIQARVDLSGERPRALSIKPREDGMPWDVYPESIGIVERVNAEKGIAAILLENGQIALAHMNSVPEAKHWAVGNDAACRVSERDGKVRVLGARSVLDLPSSSYWKEFSGEYKPRSNGPGGHAAGVFIHERLGPGIDAGQLVSGMAVQHRGDDGRSWWEAIVLNEKILHTGENNGIV